MKKSKPTKKQLKDLEYRKNLVKEIIKIIVKKFFLNKSKKELNLFKKYLEMFLNLEKGDKCNFDWKGVLIKIEKLDILLDIECFLDPYYDDPDIGEDNIENIRIYLEELFKEDLFKQLKIYKKKEK